MVVAYPDTPLQERTRKQAGLFISSDLPAGEKARNTLLEGYVNKIKAANDVAPMFSDMCIYFDISEFKTPAPVFRQAEAAKIGIIADTVNTAYRRARDRAAYLDYLKRAMDRGIETFRVDDAQNMSAAQLALILADVPGIRWVLSTGVKWAPLISALIQRVDADAKLEVQTYRHGSSTNYVQKWLTEIPMWSIAFECYRTSGGKMTTAKDIEAMGKHVIASGISSVMVYGHDENTNFLLADSHPRALGSQWQALQIFLARWWGSGIKAA